MLSRVWSFPGFTAALLLFAAATREDGGPRLVAAEALAGPVAAKVERVVDGDTIDVRADIWLGQTLLVRVRIDGVDAPELEARCPEERKLALAAREFLARRLGDAPVKLTRIVYDKYGGRVRADVADSKGDVGEALLAAGLARPYHGERRASWCVQT
jgi:endonuclease YncB( thermonuclease family)